MARIRTQLPGVKIGNSFDKSTNVSTDHTYYGAGYARCEDVVQVGNGGDLIITKVQEKSGGLINGETSSFKYTNYCPLALRGADVTGGFISRANLGLASDSALATRLVAMTNPSRSDVDLPIFVAELKDLPGLVKKAGGSLLKRIAKNNLKYQFAIRPLVSDLLSILNFVQLTENRLTELKQLKRSGLRRKRRLAEGSGTVSGTWDLNSTGGLVLLNRAYQRTTKAKAWGFVKWTPSTNFPATDAELLSLARRAVFGLTIDGATAWELIPFSWLIDWYGSVGAYLMATRNIVPCTHSKPRIMIQYENEFSIKDLRPPAGAYSSPLKIKTIRKTRTSTTITPFTARLPVLSAKQLSILASLVILKTGKY